MKKFLKVVIDFFSKLWKKIKWRSRKKRRRVYEVIRSSETAKFIGMKHIGPPKLGRMSILISNNRGHRQIIPIDIRKVGDDNYDVFTKYNRFLLKRIR